MSPTPHHSEQLDERLDQIWHEFQHQLDHIAREFINRIDLVCPPPPHRFLYFPPYAIKR